MVFPPGLVEIQVSAERADHKPDSELNVYVYTYTQGHAHAYSHTHLVGHMCTCKRYACVYTNNTCGRMHAYTWTLRGRKHGCVAHLSPGTLHVQVYSVDPDAAPTWPLCSGATIQKERVCAD